MNVAQSKTRRKTSPTLQEKNISAQAACRHKFLRFLMNKGLILKTRQTHVQKYMPKLFDLIEKGDIDPVVYHHAQNAARRCAGRLQDFQREAG